MGDALHHSFFADNLCKDKTLTITHTPHLAGMLYREIVDIHKFVFGMVQRPFPLPPRHDTWVVRQSGQRLLALTYPTVRPLPVLVEACHTPSDSEDDEDPNPKRRRPVHQEVHEEFQV